MAKEYRVTFGGEERVLRFSAADMRNLQRRFGFEAPGEWILAKVLGINLAIGQLKAYNLEAQMAFLAVGFSRGGKQTSESYVEHLWDKQIESGGGIHEAVWAAACAAFASGAVMGKAVDWETEATALKRVFFAKTVAEAITVLEEVPLPTATNGTEEAMPISSSNGPSAVVTASDSV